MNRPGVKICGITTADDAELSIRHGANHLGLIFVAKSSRAVTGTTACAIANHVRNSSSVKIVTVFQNEALDEIENIATLIKPDLIQLHGQEEPELCQRLREQIGLPIVKVLEIEPSRTDEPERLLKDCERYRQSCDYLMFDRPKHLSNDESWLKNSVPLVTSLEQRAPWLSRRFFFAGGLTADNVVTLLSQIIPLVIDVASGVESEPGRKDENKVKSFFRSVAQYQPSQGIASDSCESSGLPFSNAKTNDGKNVKPEARKHE